MPTPKPKTKRAHYDQKRAERRLRNRGDRTIQSIAEELGAPPASLYALVQRMKRRDEAEKKSRGAQGSGFVPAVDVAQHNAQADALRAAAVPDSPANAVGREALRLAKDVAAGVPPESRYPSMDPYKTIERLRGELAALRADNDRLRAKSQAPIVNTLLRENAVLRSLLNTSLEQVGLTVQSVSKPLAQAAE